MRPRPLRLLILEDNAQDAELAVSYLTAAGFAPFAKVVETEADFRAALAESFDLIITDYTLPAFDGLNAIRTVRAVPGVQPPVIVVTGTASSVEIQSRVIAPAMWRIGELWERGALTVVQEHLATAMSHHALTRLYPGLLSEVQRRGDTIVVAVLHGDHHVLGLRMAADVLEGAGFDVRFLGADVPQSSLLAWVAEHRPTRADGPDDRR
jgi:CheY-like chemotaxis protein